MDHYAQILARTGRPTQILGTVQSADVYVFPYSPAGTLICEKTSSTLDVRIVLQVARDISYQLGRGPAVLAIAGNEGKDFWCGLFDGGERRFRHNRLVGSSGFGDEPASPSQIEVLCGYFGPEVDRDLVRAILTSRDLESAVERHGALAHSLGLPPWSPGIGYVEAAEGRAPPEAGVPRRPSRSLSEHLGPDAMVARVEGSDPLRWFHDTCGRSFDFLEKEFGFRRAESPAVDHYTRMIDGVMVIGTGNLRPGYVNAYISCYRSEHLMIVIEGLSHGGRTRLCLIDSRGRHLDFTRLVEHRDPELIDLCRLAKDQSEQLPIFARALHECGADVLSGDLSRISRRRRSEPGFSFSNFSSRADADYVLALHGPRGRPRTFLAKVRRAIHLQKIKAGLRKRR